MPVPGGESQVAAQAAPAGGLGFGHHHGAFGGALGTEDFGGVVGGLDGLEVVDRAPDGAGVQAEQDLLGEELVRRGQEAVAPAGFAFDLVAQGLQAVEALPDPGPAETHPGRQDFAGDKGRFLPQEIEDFQEAGVGTGGWQQGRFLSVKL